MIYGGMGVQYSPEFSGIPFVMGSVRGMRSFKVSPDYMVTGLYFRQVWTADENVAAHLANPSPTNFMYAIGGTAVAAAMSDPEDKKYAPVVKVPDGHNYPKCVCGFYAYYTGENHHQLNGSITGIIEGYGETVIGSKGFRCSKARIIALCSSQLGHLDLLDEDEMVVKLAENYPKVPIFDNVIDMKAEFLPLVSHWD